MNEEKKEIKYLTIRVGMLQGMFDDLEILEKGELAVQGGYKKVITKMIHRGIADYASHFECKDEAESFADVGRLYMNNKWSDLPEDLFVPLDTWLDGDTSFLRELLYVGYKQWYPEKALEWASEQEDENGEFLITDEYLERCKFFSTILFLLWNLEIEASAKDIYLLGEENPREVLTMVTVPMLMDFCKNEKTVFELMLFCVFVAIRSLLGKGKDGRSILYAKTNWKALLKRAAPGAPKEIREQYEKRYWREKIFDYLQEDWHVKYYSSPTIDGFYVSISLSYDKLTLYALQHSNKRKLKKKERLANQAAAKKKAYETLGLA